MERLTRIRHISVLGFNGEIPMRGGWRMSSDYLQPYYDTDRIVMFWAWDKFFFRQAFNIDIMQTNLIDPWSWKN